MIAKSAQKERPRRCCEVLVVIICLQLIAMIYLFPNSEVISLYQHRLQTTIREISSYIYASEQFSECTELDRRRVKNPYLRQEFYDYTNLTAKLKCEKRHFPFRNFSSDLILKCGAAMWENMRNLTEVDPWRVEASNPSQTVDLVDISNRPAANWVFVGDSHIRYIFEVLVKRLANTRIKYRIASFEKNQWENPLTMLSRKRRIIHEDYHEVIHPDIPLKITYRWEATLQNLPKHLRSWISGNTTRPAALLFGTALHFMKATQKVYLKEGQEKAAENFAQHLKFLSPLLSNFSIITPTIYKLQDHLQKHAVNTISNNPNIDHYNGIAKTVLSGTGIVLWDSTLPLADVYNEECRLRYKNTPATDMWKCRDRRHIGYIMIEQYLDMFLNYICNDVLR